MDVPIVATVQSTGDAEKIPLSRDLVKHNDSPSSTDQASENGSAEVQETTEQQIPPDGGLQAWLQVLAGHMLFFNSWGLINTFGSYQSYYSTNLLENYSTSAISWIGAIQGFLLVESGIFSGPLSDLGHIRPLIMVGTVVVVFGMMMTSLSTDYYQIFLAQGVVVGLGMGAYFTAGIAVVASWFEKRRSLAMGIAATGTGTGGVIYPVIFGQLIDRVGFGWTTRILAFIILATLSIPILVMKPFLKPPAPRSFLDPTAWRDLPFIVFSIGTAVAFIGNDIPSFFLPLYGEIKIHSSAAFSSYFLSIFNGSSILGRLVLNAIADEIGPFNTLIPCTILSAVICYAWIAVSSTGGLAAFSACFGFNSGAYAALLPPVIVTALCPDISYAGTRMGMSSALGAIGILVGNPAAGAFVNVENQKFLGLQLFGGSFLLLGSLLIVWAWWVKVVKLDRSIKPRWWKI